MESVGNNQDQIVPFLRWAGGKRWLTNTDFQIAPENYQTYYEPFLGGGAVFFYLQPKKAKLSDSNQKLIDTYKAIKSDWKKVQREINKHDNLHSKNYYYEARDKTLRSPYSKAGQFIYLNRTCWNGLYRVNRSGKFNVPIGTKRDVKLPGDDFKAIAKCLKLASLTVCDFEKAIDKAEKDDFIFADPPYTVQHNYNGFVQYNESIFQWDDQVRLCGALGRAHKRGVKFTLTNANHDMIKDLYHGYAFESLKRASVLAGLIQNRGETEELVVRNWS